MVSRLPPPTSRPIQTRFPFGSAAERLSLAGDDKSPDHYAKGTPSGIPLTGHSPPTACRRVVSGSVSSPGRGSSQLSLALLFAIGHQRVLSLAGWSPPLRAHFHVVSATQDATRPPTPSPTGLSPAAVRHSRRFGWDLGSYWRSYNPGGRSPRFGLIRFRSPLLAESLSLSPPPGTEMFQFPGLARAPRDQRSVDSSPGTIAACRALPPPGAQTSPTRP